MGAKILRGFTALAVFALFATLLTPPSASAVAGSISFSGSNYLSATATNSKFNFGTGDFTVEWWQKYSAGGAARIFSFGCYSSQRFQASLEGGTLYIGINGSWVAYPALSNYQDKWTHIAIVRSSGTLSIYQNGTSLSSTSYPTAIDASSFNLAIGAENSGCTYRSGTYFTGLLAKMRMTKSVIYSAAFTPSASYGLVANTVFMLDTDTSAPVTDSGNTGTAVTFTNNGSVASNAEVPALPKQSQSALSIVQSSATYKDALSLTTSGGSGSGSVTFTKVSGPCTISGSTLTPTGAGTCVVNATKGGDASYDPITSSNKSISISAKALTITGISIPDKNYNGNTSASIAGTPTLSGVIAGDVVTLVSASAVATFSTAIVGNNKSVTISGYSISGTNSSGYSLSQPSGYTASILRGAPSITATAPSEGTYRSPVSLTFSNNSITGRVTFYLGKNRLPGCINRPITAATSYAFTCTWKPSQSGLLRPHAIFTPTDSNYATTTQQFPTTTVSRRTSKR